MSSEIGRQAERSGMAFGNSSPPRRGETVLGRAWARAAGLRFPSCFLLATLRLPGWKRAVPIIFPLFVLEDLLESAGRLMSVFSFLFPTFSLEMPEHLGKDGGSSGDGRAGGCERSYPPSSWLHGWALASEHHREREGRLSIEFSIRDAAPWFLFLARAVRALRLEGRFTLIHVVEGASGTEISIRLV